MKGTSYQLLNAIGIPYWMSRSHPAALFVSDNPLFCAACLVLLPGKLSKEAVEQRQMLTGMLKVLELKEDEICVAWANEGATLQECEPIESTLVKWAPYSILIMGEAFAKGLLRSDSSMEDLRMHVQSLSGVQASIQVTYHPVELQKIKETKRKTYQDLLRLKEHLSWVKTP